MEGLRADSKAVRYIASRMGADAFTLIDVGCSGGLDVIWRAFGGNLRAFGFDPSVDECRRLQDAETSPGVRYVPAFVGLPVDDPIVRRRGSRPHFTRNPWYRLSAARTIATQQARMAALTNEQKAVFGRWTETKLADAATPVVLTEFFSENGVDDIDFLKIDIDGADFDILQSLSDTLQQRQVLAASLEVNFIGSDDETEHTFHNTDRFMRAHGFDLFRLSIRSYSKAALPARYTQSIPSASVSGRPYQGDAVYARDLGDPERPDQATAFSALKLAKLCAIYACFGLPDCAAEILLQHRERLDRLLDVDHLLDLLCDEAQTGREQRLRYSEYMEAFDRDDASFYPSS